MIIPKVLFDQFVYNPPWATPSVLIAFYWRDSGFSFRRTWTRLTSRSFWTWAVPECLISMWCVWIPACSLIYIVSLGRADAVVRGARDESDRREALTDLCCLCLCFCALLLSASCPAHFKFHCSTSCCASGVCVSHCSRSSEGLARAPLVQLSPMHASHALRPHLMWPACSRIGVRTQLARELIDIAQSIDFDFLRIHSSSSSFTRDRVGYELAPLKTRECVIDGAQHSKPNLMNHVHAATILMRPMADSDREEAAERGRAIQITEAENQQINNVRGTSRSADDAMLFCLL